MDRDRLSRLLEEPGKVAREDLADLKALTERYPWFSGAHLLRTVGEQAGGDVLADEALQACAAHIPSRSVLFDLKDVSMEQAAADLKNKKEARSGEIIAEEITPEVIEVEEQPEASVAAELPSPAETSVPAEVPVIPADQEDNATSPALIPEIIAEQHTTGKEISVEADRPETAVADASPAELEEQIMQAALANAYDLTWQERLAIPEERPSPPARRSITSFIQEDKGAASEKTSVIGSDPLPLRPIEQPASPVQVTKGAKLKFTDWLQAAETGKVEAKSEEPATRIDRSETAAPEIPAAEPDKPAIVDPMTLIDRFIEQETPAPVRKTEFYSPQQAAKKSLDDTAGLVSETLAKVYAKQGNIPKAIEAYRRLALKYPEKSAYFAALSKELESKLNA